MHKYTGYLNKEACDLVIAVLTTFNKDISVTITLANQMK